MVFICWLIWLFVIVLLSVLIMVVVLWLWLWLNWLFIRLLISVLMMVLVMFDGLIELLIGWMFDMVLYCVLYGFVYCCC